jgi:FMN phosphatase YigB (HAD superfamily)
MKSKKIILFDIDDTLFNTARFKETNATVFSVYDDVIHVLEELKNIADLGIFSEGQIALQKSKLSQTNIEKYFLAEHVNIVEKKVDAIEKLAEKYKSAGKIFLVEDRLPILPLIKKDFPSLFTIWIKQGRYAPFQESIDGFSPDAQVDTVKDIIPLITSH